MGLCPEHIKYPNSRSFSSPKFFLSESSQGAFVPPLCLPPLPCGFSLLSEHPHSLLIPVLNKPHIFAALTLIFQHHQGQTCRAARYVSSQLSPQGSATVLSFCQAPLEGKELGDGRGRLEEQLAGVNKPWRQEAQPPGISPVRLVQVKDCRGFTPGMQSYSEVI